MYCAQVTADDLSVFRVHTLCGTTYVIPLKCDQCIDESTCVLENSHIVRLIAEGHTIKNVRYIKDSVRPVLLVEI